MGDDVISGLKAHTPAAGNIGIVVADGCIELPIDVEVHRFYPLGFAPYGREGSDTHHYRAHYDREFFHCNNILKDDKREMSPLPVIER